ncbi:MAG: histidine phosphatase family protein [Chloroflexi bacterium]|nr:histidine phosphatase family protein [Chloroflexota bacterium]
MTTETEFELDIYFIRHGESASNVVPGLAAGKNWDAAMTERGHRQSFALGERLKDDGVTFDAIYSSSQVRAVETTQGMLKGMGTPNAEFTRVDEIIELQVPGWRGVPREEVYTPEMRLRREQLGKWYVPDGGGESEKAVERRFSNWLEDEVLANPSFTGNGNTRIAIISHGLALRCVFHNILEFQDRYIRRIAIANTSISRFKFVPTGWFPVSINDAWHTRDIGDVTWEGPLDITP